MATTVVQQQTVPVTELLSAPVSVVDLEGERRAVNGNDSNAQVDERRVFAAAPITATSVGQNSRFLVTSLLVAINIVQFLSNFVTISGGLALSAALGRKVEAGQANWMAAAYSLTQGAFVLITGRLGSIYGHQRMVLIGSLLFTTFSLSNALCKSYNAFIAVRALTGVGGGIFMPNAVAIIMTMTPPGRTRNLTMGFFATSPPIGGVIGAILAGIFTEMVDWEWLFVLIAGLAAIPTALLAWLFPREQLADPHGKIDIVGAFLGLGSLLMFNFVWNQAPAVGWQTDYEIACLVVSVALFVSFLIWEKSFAAEPIMPLNVFRTPTFASLIFVVLLTYMSIGISLWYSISWQQILRETTVLQTGVNFLPFGLGSVASVAIAAWLIPRIAAQWILGLGVLTCVGSNLLLATMPIKQAYWAQAFPATTLISFSPDFVYVAAQLIASNSVGRRHQGVASSLVGTLNLYGNSLGLGFAGTIEVHIARGHEVGDLVHGYRAALYFGVALAVAGLLLNFAFVRMPRDEREGWDEALDREDNVQSTGSSTAIEMQPQRAVTVGGTVT